ncbi:MAG: NADP-dependent oxidoreductase [Sphingomonadales bacterium]
MTTASNRPVNRKVVLVSHVNGLVGPEHFRIEEEAAGAPGEGQVLVETEYLSIDAFIRTSLNDVEGFHQKVAVGTPVVALGVGRVIESNAPGLAAGDTVTGGFGAQTHPLLPAAALQKVDAAVPPSAWLGALGLTTGVTAYFGIVEVAQAKPDQTVVVSGAAGAVGSMASQLAKIAGARVIGIAGGPEKTAFLTGTLGLDAAIDYKGEDVAARLKALAPGGIDVFFDNVGGDILDAALDNLAERARVVICGAISQYNDQQNVKGPSRYLKLAERYARMEGYTVLHFTERFPQAYADLGRWLAEGRLVMPEQVEHGIESFPGALRKLFLGGNTGKMLVKP